MRIQDINVPLLVQKFGGTSLADSGKILAAARRAIQAHNRGDQVLVVVSARGHTTDELIELAKEITESPPAREMDMLLATGEQVSVALMAMAIGSLGVPAISFTGAQIGLVTDSFHTKARIRNISTERMVQALGDGKIVIVAGFQGVDEHYNITTLGRGGSDTTAVALAAVLGAAGCEIYTDVDGVYTTDPRIVPEARKIDRISYDEMLELASLGAGVMHSRSIEFAKKYGVPIHVRSSFSDAAGTWIVDERDAERLGAPVTGAALAKDEARITIRGVPDRPGVVHAIFRTIAAAKIVVDMIVQNVSRGRHDRSQLHGRQGRPARDAARGGGSRARDRGDVGHPRRGGRQGLGRRPGHAHPHRRRDHDVRGPRGGRHQHSDDHDERDQDQRAGRPGLGRGRLASGPPGVCSRAVERRIRRRSLPRSPAQDKPRAMKLVPLVDADADTAGGEAALGRTAAAGDGRPGHRRGRSRRVAGPGLAVSRARPAGLRRAGLPRDRQGRRVRRHDRPERRDGRRLAAFVHGAAGTRPTVRSQAVQKAGIAEVSVEPALAKLSVVGVGMRTHTGVATRMFAALAERGININLINTSEVRINVGTDISRGREGLECLRRAFALATR